MFFKGGSSISGSSSYGGRISTVPPTRNLCNHTCKTRSLRTLIFAVAARISSSFITTCPLGSYTENNVSSGVTVNRRPLLPPHVSIAAALGGTTRHRQRKQGRENSRRLFRTSAMSTTDGEGGACIPAKFTVAACQILCGENKAENIKSAQKAVQDAAAHGAKVCLCRYFCSGLLG